MEWGQPVARVGVVDEDVLPDVERIVTIISKKIGVGITREREGERKTERERGREKDREREGGKEGERGKERGIFLRTYTINSLLIQHSE